VRITLLVAAVAIAFLPWTNRSWFSLSSTSAPCFWITRPASSCAEGALALMETYGHCLCIHVIAGGRWVGGLPPLLFLRSEQRLFGPHEGTRMEPRYIVPLFLDGDGGVTLIVVTASPMRAPRRRLGRQSFSTPPTAMRCSQKMSSVMLTLAVSYRFVADARLRAALLKGMDKSPASLQRSA